MKSKSKALQHFKVNEVLKIDETFHSRQDLWGHGGGDSGQEEALL